MFKLQKDNVEYENKSIRLPVALIEEVQRLAFLKMKYEWDYNSGIKYAEEKALAKGKAEGRSSSR